jgi:hypothetical protein
MLRRADTQFDKLRKIFVYAKCHCVPDTDTNTKPRLVGLSKSNLYIFSLPSPFWKIQEVLERANRLLSFIRHGPHWKLGVQQFFYCCVCIRYRGNDSTEPLPSNDKGIFTEPMSRNDKGGYTHTHTATWSHKPIFSLLYLFWNNDKGIFTEPLPSNDRGTLPSRCLAMIRGLLPSRCLATVRGIHRHTHRQQRDLISLLLFFSK